MNVFLSYAVGQFDAPIAARLRAVAAAYDISILLPDRTQPANNSLPADMLQKTVPNPIFSTPHANVNNKLPADTLQKIRQSGAVIALVTSTAQVSQINLVNLELQAAAQIGRPIIALVEHGIKIQGPPENQIVYFDRLNPTAHEHQLMTALEQVRQQQRKNDLTALGWIAGIALGLVALGELLSDKK